MCSRTSREAQRKRCERGEYSWRSSEMWGSTSSSKTLKHWGPLSWSRMPRQMPGSIRWALAGTGAKCLVSAWGWRGHWASVRPAKFERALCALVCGYSWGRRTPMFSHTRILDHLCRWLPWANHLSSGERRDRPLRARIRKSTFLSAVSLQRLLLAELNIVFTGQKARCWKACPLCEEWGQWGKLSAESQ